MRTLLTSLLLISACGGSDEVPSPDLGQPTGVALEVACTDSIDAVYGDPGALPDQAGAILKCARDRDLPRAELQATVDADGWTSGPVTSGAHLYRVLYKTERGTTPAQPGYSSALLLLPDTPRAARLPVVVARHATRGQNGACVASKIGPLAENVNPDYRQLVYGLVGFGYAVLATDGAGFANYGAAGNPAPAYSSATDSAKSVLDGERALRNLVPSALSEKNVLVGHSEGGHAVLAALALADSYGPQIDAVVAYAPVWIPQRSWGGLLALPTVYPFATSGSLNAEDIWYHYAAGELMDGPGHGQDVFAAGKRAAVKDFVDTACFDYPNWSKLNALGSSAADVYDPAFVSAISDAAAGFSANCSSPLCTKWMNRYAEDRPHLTGHAATVPIFIAWGSDDQSIAYDRFACAIERLQQDQANLQTLCVSPGHTHADIVGNKADVAADWIAQQTMGGPAPAACPSSIVTDPMGQPAVCNPTPPNTDH